MQYGVPTRVNEVIIRILRVSISRPGFLVWVKSPGWQRRCAARRGSYRPAVTARSPIGQSLDARRAGCRTKVADRDPHRHELRLRRLPPTAAHHGRGRRHPGGVADLRAVRARSGLARSGSRRHLGRGEHHRCRCRGADHGGPGPPGIPGRDPRRDRGGPVLTVYRPEERVLRTSPAGSSARSCPGRTCRRRCRPPRSSSSTAGTSRTAGRGSGAAPRCGRAGASRAGR